jgi:hypothetical protein
MTRLEAAEKVGVEAAERLVREQFRYKGQAIFGPHISVDRLAEVLTEQDIKDVRD